VHVKDIDTGTETIVTEDAAAPEAYPRISSDGSPTATDTTKPGESNGILWIVERRNLVSQRILGPGHVWDWSHDNKRWLYHENAGEIRCLDIASSKDLFQFSDTEYDLYQAKFAPGERFVAVEAVDKRDGINSRIFVVPVGENVQVHKKTGWRLTTAACGTISRAGRPMAPYSILSRTATAISAFGRSAWTVNPNGHWVRHFPSGISTAPGSVCKVWVWG
jgi:hypothetical protein